MRIDGSGSGQLFGARGLRVGRRTSRRPDDLDPARGLLIGALLGLAFWGAVLALVFASLV